MKSIHLTEEEIQQYAMYSSASNALAREHAISCEECKARVANYQLLFREIKQQPQPVFDFNLAQLVITQLPSVKPGTSQDNLFVYPFVLSIIALTGAALYYFRTYIANLFASIAPLLIYLTATTVVTLALILSMDMYKNYQKKMRALEFN